MKTRSRSRPPAGFSSTEVHLTLGAHYSVMFNLYSGSESGKSFFMKELLKHRQQVFDEEFHSITWCFRQKRLHLYYDFIQELREIVPHIRIGTGLPDSSTLRSNSATRKVAAIKDSRTDFTPLIIFSCSLSYWTTWPKRRCNHR